MTHTHNKNKNNLLIELGTTRQWERDVCELPWCVVTSFVLLLCCCGWNQSIEEVWGIYSLISLTSMADRLTRRTPPSRCPLVLIRPNKRCLDQCSIILPKFFALVIINSPARTQFSCLAFFFSFLSNLFSFSSRSSLPSRCCLLKLIFLFHFFSFVCSRA